LLVLVSRELDRGFALLDVATTRTSPLFAQAERAYDLRHGENNFASDF
jgi:hypothetical protein